jgi:hypothetical protein
VSGGEILDIGIGDKLLMKKKHPCGSDIFTVTRIGMDFRLRCDGCGHEVMLPRQKAEKGLKKIIKMNGEENV